MGNVTELTDANFDAEVMKSPLPVLVDFSATWCGPCKILAPVVEELAGDFAGRLKVVKVDIDAAQESTVKFNITSVPTLVLLRGGKEIGRTMGAQPKDRIVKQLESALG